MWNAFVQRRNGGGYDETMQFIELSDDDCELLVAAGLKIQKGASPRDLYCFQNLPAYYDGTPLQVLRLLEEARSAGRMPFKAPEDTAAANADTNASEVRHTKRQRVSGGYAPPTGLLSTMASWRLSKGGLEVDLELLDDGDNDELPETIRITSSSTKFPPSPVKSTRSSYHKVSSPVSASFASPVKTPQTARHSHRGSMKVDILSAQEETPSTSSARKRKSEASSMSPLATLFSPISSIRTPSPGLKTRRTSVLKEFKTPEQPTGSATPETVPAQPKRSSTTTTRYTKTTTSLSDYEDDDDEANDGLVDDAPEVDERACCDVKSVVEPIWDALQRTSSRFQNAWEEVRSHSSSLVLIPVSDEDPEPRAHIADVRDDAVDLLVFEGDAITSQEGAKNDLIDPWADPVESGRVGVRTRRQRNKSHWFSAPWTWRLW